MIGNLPQAFIRNLFCSALTALVVRATVVFSGVVTATGACAAPAEPEFLPIWSDPKEDGVAGYHLPQIVVTRRGIVIALAEARHRWGDGVKTDVVIRRSGDGGRTWSKSLFVARAEGEDNHVLPVLFEERSTRRIFFFCACRDEGGKDKTTENFYRTSDDDGITWSEKHDITEILTAADARLQAELRAGRAGLEFAGDDPELFGRKLFFFGPGRPIQLSTRHRLFPDRLVVPLFIMKDRLARPRAKRAYGNGVLVSDDRGATWRVGGIAPLGEYGSSEVSIVELDDGRLLLNSRGAPPESNGFSIAGRTLSYSSDGGATWTRPGRTIRASRCIWKHTPDFCASLPRKTNPRALRSYYTASPRRCRPPTAALVLPSVAMARFF